MHQTFSSSVLVLGLLSDNRNRKLWGGGGMILMLVVRHRNGFQNRSEQGPRMLKLPLTARWFDLHQAHQLLQRFHNIIRN